jgi:uroporphyrinogen-III synthase
MNSSGHAADRQQERATRALVAAASVRVLVWTLSRPAAVETRSTLAGAGVVVLDLPLIGTRLVRRSGGLSKALKLATQDSRRIYVSVAAVEAIGRLAPELLQLPSAAVGPQTAEALRAAGCRSVWQPAAGLGADALMALPHWASLSPATVTLLHAPGGQEAPFERLAELGLRCRKLQVYQRYRRRPTATILGRLRSQLSELAWLAPSVGVTDALADLLAADASLGTGFERPLLSLSERIAQRAAQRGFHDCRVVADLHAGNLLTAIRSAESRPGEA